MATKINFRKLLPKAGGLALGAAGAAMLETKVLSMPAVANVVPEKLRPLLPAAVGVFLSKNRNELVSYAGYGMIAYAGFRLVQGFTGGILGIGRAPYALPGPQVLPLIDSTAETAVSGLMDPQTEATGVFGPGMADGH